MLTFSSTRLVIILFAISAGFCLWTVLFVLRTYAMRPEITDQCANCESTEEVTYLTPIPCLCFIKLCLVCCVTMVKCYVCEEVISSVNVVLDETERM